MGDLSRDFSKHEFECPCCGRMKVDIQLVDCLQRLRDLVKVPVRVTSGYRCEERQEKVSDSKRSQHMTGEAADITMDGLSVCEIYTLAEQIPEFAGGGIGIYPDEGFVHVDVRDGRARWSRVKGRYGGIWKAVGRKK